MFRRIVRQNSGISGRFGLNLIVGNPIEFVRPPCRWFYAAVFPLPVSIQVIVLSIAYQTEQRSL